MTVSRLSPVAHDVASSNDLANSEESEDLSGSHTIESQLLLVGVAQTAEKGLGGGDVHVAKVGGVADNVDDGLEVGLESSQVAEVSISEPSSYDTSKGCCLRRSHLLAPENKLGEFDSDFRVVDSRGYQSCYRIRLTILIL